MALTQVATNTLTSAASAVSITGIDTDDVYQLHLNNVAPSVDNKYLRVRFTESGTPNTTSNYDYAQLFLYTSGTLELPGVNGDKVNINNHTNGTGTSETTNGIYTIFNANDSSEYTQMLTESVNLDSSAGVYGSPGGIVFTVASAVDGVSLYYDSGNIATGTFTLYRVT